MPPVRVFYSAQADAVSINFQGIPCGRTIFAQVGCSTLQDAKATFKFVRNATQDVPPGPVDPVIQVRVTEPRMRPVVQIAEPEKRNKTPTRKHLAALDIYLILFFVI